MIEFILLQLFRASVFLAVGFPIVWLLIRLGRFRSALGQRFAWGTLLVFSLLCMTVPLQIPVAENQDIPVQKQEMPEIAASIPVVENNRPLIEPQEFFVPQTKPLRIESGNENITPTIIESRTFSWKEFLENHILQTIFTVWLFGLFFVWCRRGVAQVMLWKILRTSTPSEDKQWSALLEQYGVTKTKIPLQITDSAGPALVRGSWFRLSLIVPNVLWDELSPDLRQGVLRHELGHFRHGDTWFSPLIFFLASLQWFNPLAWLTLRRYDEATEWHADEFAYANRTDGCSELAETFLHIHRSTESLGLYMNSFSRYDTLDRVNRLLPDVTKENFMKKLIITTLIILFLSCGVIRLQLVAKPETTPPLPSHEDRTLECFIKDKDEKPILDAKVIVHLLPKGVNPWDDDKPIARYQLRSDENGRIEFTVTKKQAEIPGMVLHIAAAHPDYIGYGQIFENYANFIGRKSLPDAQSFTTITLEPAVKISGTVIDTNGQPAAETLVFAFSFNNRTYRNQPKTTTRTDRNGKFTINMLAEDNDRWLWILPNDAAPLTRKLKEDETDLGTLRLEKGVILEGRAIDNDGQPVSDLWLSLLLDENTPATQAQGHDPACRATVTDKDGRFRFRPLMPGKYYLGTNILMEYDFYRQTVPPESAYVNLAMTNVWSEKPVSLRQLPKQNTDVPFTGINVQLSDQPIQHLEYRAAPTIDLTLKPTTTLRNENLKWIVTGNHEKTSWDMDKIVSDITKPLVLKIPWNLTDGYLKLFDSKVGQYYPLRFRISGSDKWSNNWYVTLGDTAKAIILEVEPYEPGLLKVAARKPDGTPVEHNSIQIEYKNVDFKDPIIVTTDGREVRTGIERCSPEVEFSVLDGKPVMWRYHPVLADEEFTLQVNGDEKYFDPAFQTLRIKPGELKELIVPLKNRTEKEPKLDDTTNIPPLPRKILPPPGYVVSGQVTDENGTPISGAAIRAVRGNTRIETKTDTIGKYRLEQCQPEPFQLFASAEKHAYKVTEIEFKSDDATEKHGVNFQLKPGGTLRIHVTEKDGTPVPDASIFFRSGKNVRNDNEPLWGMGFPGFMKVNENGTWETHNAPKDGIFASSHAPGKRYTDWQLLLPRDEEYVFVLTPVLAVTGTVLDADTREPIKKMTIVPGVIADDRDMTLHWMRDKSYEATEGQYRYALNGAFFAHAFRIEADGYLPYVSRLMKNEGDDLTIHVTLKKGKNIESIVLDDEKRPVIGADVLLGVSGAQIMIENGKVDSNTYCDRRKTDARGHFTFPPQTEKCNLIIVYENGVANIFCDPTDPPQTITLEKWARVDGKLHIDAPMNRVSRTISAMPFSPTASRSQANIRFDASVVAEPDGRFSCDKILPGKTKVGQMVEFARSESSVSFAWSHSCIYTLVPGETKTIQIGGAGRTVIGKFVIPENFETETEIDWNFSLVRMSKKESDTKKEKQSPDIDGVACAVDSDGSFRIESVPPGDWTLFVILKVGRDPPFGDGGFAHMERNVTVPDGPTEEPFDLDRIIFEAAK